MYIPFATAVTSFAVKLTLPVRLLKAVTPWGGILADKTPLLVIDRLEPTIMPPRVELVAGTSWVPTIVIGPCRIVSFWPELTCGASTIGWAETALMTIL